jgi:hypothetical protein
MNTRRLIVLGVAVAGAAAIAGCGPAVHTEYVNGVEAGIMGHRVDDHRNIVRVDVNNVSTSPRKLTLGYQYCGDKEYNGPPINCTTKPILLPSVPWTPSGDSSKAASCHGAANKLVDLAAINKGATSTEATLPGHSCAVFEFLVPNLDGPAATSPQAQILIDASGSPMSLYWGE